MSANAETSTHSRQTAKPTAVRMKLMALCRISTPDGHARVGPSDSQIAAGNRKSPVRRYYRIVSAIRDPSVSGGFHLCAQDVYSSAVRSWNSRGAGPAGMVSKLSYDSERFATPRYSNPANFGA